MTQRVFVGLLTVVVFAAGYGTRALTDREKSVPAPPAALERELAKPASGKPGENKGKGNEVDRAQLVADIHKLRSQIDAYIAQVHDIEAEFDKAFDALLTPKQREKRAGYLKFRAEREAKRLADREPLSDEAIQRERERPLTDIYWMVTVTPRFERLIKEYELTEEQQAATRAALSVRRTKFTALFEATPHPAIRLTRLAPIVERVQGPAGEPAKK